MPLARSVMPTSRKRMPHHRRAPPVGVEWWALLHDEPIPEDGNPFARFTFEDEAPRLWTEYGPTILHKWTARAPGTRPSLWWRFDAPRMCEIPPEHRGCYYSNDLREPRRRLGGKGAPAHSVLNIAPHYERGLPTHWVSDWDIDYYNGRARDVKGERIGTAYSDGDFVAEHFDPDDPPVFESGPTYLRRLKLLIPGEARRLRRTDYAPEILPRGYWPAP